MGTDAIEVVSRQVESLVSGGVSSTAPYTCGLAGATSSVMWLGATLDSPNSEQKVSKVSRSSLSALRPTKSRGPFDPMAALQGAINPRMQGMAALAQRTRPTIFRNGRIPTRWLLESRASRTLASYMWD